MISLIIPKGGQISLVNQMLTNEYGTAVNIKSRTNRLSVLSAITSAQQKLKNYKQIPENGLVIYVGTVMQDGKERKVAFDFEPIKPINTSLYYCDSRFHTEPLRELFENEPKYGFVIMDGNGCLFGTLQGSQRTIVTKFSVELPKKHGRGGQSSVRFARLRVEKRHNYLRRVAETCTTVFITNDRPNVAGLVLAGSAEFKQQLATSDLFDARLRPIVVAIVDISYGGELGFNQAIELSGESLTSVKFVKEKKLLSEYYQHLAKNTGLACYGVKETLAALDCAAIDTIIIWENLPHNRYILRDKDTGELIPRVLDPQAESDVKNFMSDAGKELEVVEKEQLIDWITNNYKQYNCKLAYVTNKSQEGAQFVAGFGGIGAILRYQFCSDITSTVTVRAFIDDDSDEEGGGAIDFCDDDFI